MKTIKVLTCAAIWAWAGLALAHGDAGHAAKGRTGPIEKTAFGQSGDPAGVVRSIEVEMNDRMRFVPDRISIRIGDTVRFRVRNTGKVMHEMVIGTTSELRSHAELMKKHPDMEHDEPYMVHVAPGKVGDIVWQFTQAGEFRFGCLVPGHFESGMVGTLVVTKGAKQ